MSRLPKELSDLVKRGQGWRCGNKKCPYGKGGKPASIKSGGQIHHKDGNPDNNKISNLVALCAKCHRQIRIKRKKEWPLTLFPG
jgi:hypothetical protein